MVGSLDFLIVMAVLYLVECVRRVGPDELTLDRRLRSGFRLKRPAPYPNSARWGWVLLNPLRPDGPTFSVMPSACLLADPGKCPTEEACLRNLDAARFDLDGIKEACAATRRRTSSIRTITLALLAVCFGLFPAGLFFLGLQAALVPAAAAVLLVSMCIAALYRRNAKSITPDMTIPDLYGNVARFVLYPISAIRCMDLLSRDSLAAFDPIAVTTVLCSSEEGARLAAREVIILRCGVMPEDMDSDSRAVLAAYRAARLRLLESFIARQALPMQPFTDPPKRCDETCETYCPACGVQFRLLEGICPDCQNIVLQPLPISKRLQAVGSKKEEHA